MLSQNDLHVQNNSLHIHVYHKTVFEYTYPLHFCPSNISKKGKLKNTNTVTNVNIMGPQRITIKNICFPNYLFGAIIIFQNRFLPSFLGVAKTRIGKQKGTENGKNTMKFLA